MVKIRRFAQLLARWARSRSTVRAALARTGRLPYLPRWLLFGLAVGPPAGLAALAVGELADLVTTMLGAELTGGDGIRSRTTRAWVVPVVVAGGALLAGLAADRIASGARSRVGVDAVVNAANTDPRGIRLRGPVGRACTAVVTVGAGGSGGILGPAGHIGAAIGSAVARIFGLRSADARIAVAAGLAAAVGAMLRAPLAGAAFGAELLVLRGMAISALPPALLCSTIAFGSTIVFGSIIALGVGSVSGLGAGMGVLATQVVADGLTAGPTRPVEYGAMILLGGAAGAAGRLYAAALRVVGGWFSRRRAVPAVKLAAAGILVGTAGLFTPVVVGPGYPAVNQLTDPARLLAEPLWIVALAPFVKILCTSLTLGSGAPAGVFGPGLVIGASTGAVCWRLAELVGVATDSPAIFILAGAVAGIGSVSHTPVAGVVLAGEITGGLAGIPAVALAMATAAVVVGDTTLFRSQLQLGDGRAG